MPVRHPILLPTTIYEKNNDCCVRILLLLAATAIYIHS